MIVKGNCPAHVVTIQCLEGSLAAINADKQCVPMPLRRQTLLHAPLKKSNDIFEYLEAHISIP